MEFSKRTLKRTGNLSKSFKFDMENRVAQIPLHFDRSEELLDMHISKPGKPIVSDAVIDYLGELISFVPRGFSVDFALEIESYGEYDHESLLQALKITIENTFYYHDENRKKDNVLAVVFIILGILLLALENIGGMDGWYGAPNSLSAMFIETMLEVLVWVFTWEGAAILLMTYGNESTAFTQAMKRLHGISFMDHEGKVLSRLDEEQLYQGWIYLSSKEVFARNFILFSNAALCAVLSIHAVKLIADIEMMSNVDIVSFIIRGVLVLSLVICNISFYQEGGRFKKCALPLSAICLFVIVATFIYGIVTGGVSRINMLWDIILALVLLVNIICLRYMSRQNVEI